MLNIPMKAAPGTGRQKPNFTAFKHPVLAVPCPTCQSQAGSGCDIMQDHWSRDYHLERKQLAGQMFCNQYGADAEICRVKGVWIIDFNKNPTSQHI